MWLVCVVNLGGILVALEEFLFINLVVYEISAVLVHFRMKISGNIKSIL
jgi:hypothetical protein